MASPVSVIINVYNEIETIENEILSIQKHILSKLPGSELIIAEDGSTDGTKEIISKYVDDLGLIHSTSIQRKGYAKALRDAFDLTKNPYIFFSDTGNKFDFADFWKLYEVCQQYSLVIGVRVNRTDQRYRRVLTKAYNQILNGYFRVNLIDPDGGFRIYTKQIVDKIRKESWVNRDLIGSELALRTIFSGGNVGHVPVQYRERFSTSKGLPPMKIPKVMFRVLRNFPNLKKVIAAPSYPKMG